MFENHPNALIARQLWSAVADGDAEAIEDILASEIVWRTVGQNPLSGEYHGVEEVLDYLTRIGESAEEFNSQMNSVFVNEEGVIVGFHGSGRRSGKRMEMDYLLVLSIDDGFVTSALSVPVDQPANDEFWS